MAEKKQPAKTTQTFYIGTGRRKTAVARVRITEGKGNVIINDRPVDQYFAEDKDRAAVLGPLKVTEQLNRVDVFVKTTGGGVTGQAGAVSQGIARALKTMFSPETEHKRHTFNNTVVVKSYRNEARERERARAMPAKPLAPPAPAAPVKPASPLLPAGAPGPAAAAPAPAAPVDPADVASGMIKKLRDSGYLTRDARMKERKKYGLRGARRGTQFSKR
jgi:small subunit ribosomal protein S9